MSDLSTFLAWAFARHHNLWSWYLRPLFLLPFFYFGYKRNVVGLLLTSLAVVTSMFWFPAPVSSDPRASAFLTMEREYLSSPLTLGKAAFIALIPVWFVAMGWAVWRRSLIAAVILIASATLLKVVWSFYYGGEAAWSVVPAVLVWVLVCVGVLLYWYRRMNRLGPSRA